MNNTRKLRVVYLAGPGNVISTYQFWKKGEHDPSESNITYSGQFYSVCDKLDIQARVISLHSTVDLISDDRFIIEHRPNPLNKKNGFLYHFGQLKYGFGIMRTALQFKADYVLVSAGTHWFFLWPLFMLGIKVIPTIHCLLWPKYKPRNLANKLIDFVNGLFFKFAVYRVMSASKEITRQLGKSRININKVQEFLPYYLESDFKGIKPPPVKIKPFRLLFVGRIEKAKGVFDLLKVYHSLLERGLQVELDYCGKGSSLEELNRLTKGSDLVRCHGHCNKVRLLSILESSHCIVVPTTTSLIEGFNQVVVESVLAGRPVVTSDVCPAIDYVMPAVVKCEPDNIESYVEGIERLYIDQKFYQLKRDACASLQAQFYDEKNSWGYVLQKIISAEK